jgi:hypothetical protein
MPTLLVHNQQSSSKQPRQVRARRLRRNASELGELAGGSRPSIGQRLEHQGSRRVGDQRRNSADLRHDG